MHTKTLSELSTSLHNGDISSVELTQYYLDRIQAHNGRLNAFITVCDESALEQARAADQLLQQKTAGKLTGIPLAHKDIFCTQGIRTSCASKMLDNFISPYNATVVEKAGPMARNAEDAALLLKEMSGFDPRDSTSVDRDVPDYAATLNESIEGLKIGLPKEYFSEGLDPQVATAIEAAIKTYESLGAIIKDITLPNTSLAVPTYYVVAPAECSSNLSRMDGVRFGHRCEDPKDLLDLYQRSRGEGFGEEVKRRIMTGTYALSAGYYDAYYLKAQQCRRLISNDFQQAFNDVDVIMGPTTPTTAFKLGDKIDDPVAMYLADIYTISTNLAGLPGMSIPAGFVDGLPVGLQIIGNYFDEARLLNVAHKYQQATDWHQQSPKIFT